MNLDYRHFHTFDESHCMRKDGNAKIDREWNTALTNFITIRRRDCHANQTAGELI